jgi:choline dehydrogenase-like flavoprotein
MHHPTSTCAIGKVVDSKLKVMGVEELRVADASVFPTNISGNTNACIMVGEKCADISLSRKTNELDPSIRSKIIETVDAKASEIY